MVTIRRGDVWLVALDPTIGAEIQKARPCVAISPPEMADHLIVIVNNDEQQMMKKGRIITSLDDRLEVVRALRIVDVTPGFTVTIYGRQGTPPIRWPDSGWAKLSGSTSVKRNTLINLNTGGTRYDYYLVWITNLGGHEQLALDQLTLYR